MRTAQALAVLACLTPLAQEDEPSLEEEVAALIERTNALESFRLVYDVETTSDGQTEEGTMEILYRAPDFGRAMVSGRIGEMDSWLIGDDIHVYLLDQGWKTARVSKAHPWAVLDERFPLPDAAAGGLTLSLSVKREPDGKPNLDVRMGHGMGERKILLGWLGGLRAASDVSREGDVFVWSKGGVSRRVSRRTGLLEELEIESSEKRFRIHLRSSELDVELPPDLLVPPREALDQPEDVELSRQLAYIPVASMRRLAFERADGWLTRTAKAFDERARADWSAVLDAIHRPLLQATHARIDADVGKKLTQAAEHLREERARDPSAEHLATLTEGLKKSRANLEGSLAESLKKELAALPPLDSVSHAGLHELEHEIYSALWNELVTAPILARHDEELAAALER